MVCIRIFHLKEDVLIDFFAGLLETGVLRHAVLRLFSAVLLRQTPFASKQRFPNFQDWQFLKVLRWHRLRL